jgi:hypothetical protein
MKKLLLLVFAFGIILNVFPQKLIIEGPDLLAKGETAFLMPKISPNGNLVAFGGEDHNGISVINFDGTGLREISNAAAAGWNLQWSPASDAVVTRVNFWSPDMRERSTAIILYNLAGDEINLSGMKDDISMPGWSRSGSSVNWLESNGQISSYSLKDNDNDFTSLSDGNKIIIINNGKNEVIAPVDGEYLFTVWSPDLSRAAISVAGKGVFVFDRRSGTIHDFGVGEYPSWIGNDHLIVMQSTDDGYKITGSEVLLYRFDGILVDNLTEEFDPPALFPHSNNEGKVVFHTLDGEIYKLRVAIK